MSLHHEFQRGRCEVVRQGEYLMCIGTALLPAAQSDHPYMACKSPLACAYLPAASPHAARLVHMSQRWLCLSLLRGNLFAMLLMLLPPNPLLLAGPQIPQISP